MKRTGRWAKRDTWHCAVCGAVFEAADAAKVTKHASQHDIQAWCLEADGLSPGQLQDDEESSG